MANPLSEGAAHVKTRLLVICTKMASSQLLWQLVKGNHAFLHKGLHGAQFSSEPGNLYNINSYKYSGECVLIS